MVGRSQPERQPALNRSHGSSTLPAPANDGVALVQKALRHKKVDARIIKDGRIVVHKEGRRLLVEVKRSGVVFSGEEDFPDESIIFEAQHIHDKANPKPWIYIVLSQHRNSMAVVGSNTEKFWIKDRMYYRCPKEYIKFKPVEVPDGECYTI